MSQLNVPFQVQFIYLAMVLSSQQGQSTTNIPKHISTHQTCGFFLYFPDPIIFLNVKMLLSYSLAIEIFVTKHLVIFCKIKTKLHVMMISCWILLHVSPTEHHPSS